MSAAWFDTHLHLDFLSDPGAALTEARAQGIAGFVVPGVHPNRWENLLTLADHHDDVWPAPGVHPQAAAAWTAAAERKLETLIADRRIVALGEIGLDGSVGVAEQTQEKTLRDQLVMAREAKLPILIHCRQATERLLSLLRQERATDVGGIWHAFSGSPETARRILDLNLALGIGGVLTYPNARRLPEVVAMVSARDLVLETDAPDLSPHPHRGEDNRPAWLSLIGERLGELREWSPAETARLTTDNARRIFNLPS